MATVIRTIKYRCLDDCSQSGCPSHEAKLTYQSVSDAYIFDNGNNEIKYFERGELEALITLVKDIGRLDSIMI